MESDLARIERLMTEATGDEKHDRSSHSTLDVLWVLYDRILHYDPKNPKSEERDRFVLSKGHGPAAFYAILADKGFFITRERCCQISAPLWVASQSPSNPLVSLTKCYLTTVPPGNTMKQWA